MKKYLALLLTLFYFGFSAGMVYNVHYCLDQMLVSTTASNTCDLCGTDKKKECCKDEVKVLKTDVAQKTDISIIGDAPFMATLLSSFYTDFVNPVPTRNQYSIISHAPPDKAEIPLFISYCNFRI